MARFLYRLGSGAARRPLMVIMVWVLVLIGAGAGMATLQKPLTTEFKLPGSDFARVLDHLGDQIPEAEGGSGTVVFHSSSGRFTEAQKKDIDKVLKAWDKEAIVKGTINPFETQAQLDASTDKVTKAGRDLQAGEKKYNDGLHKLHQLDWMVGQGQQDIKKLQRSDPGNATLPSRESGQVKLERMQTQGQARLDDARAKLDDGWTQFRDGEALSRLSQGARFVSEDGTTALTQIRFDGEPQTIDPEVLAKIPELGKQLDGTGVEVNYGQEIVHVAKPGGIGEAVGLVVAGLVLLLMLGSLLMAGMPLVIAFVGVGVSLMFGMAATQFVPLHQMAPILGMMLGLAVGIDYALFILNRHRRQLQSLESPSKDEIRHSIGLAAGTAGNAVVVAGTTVIIALAALLVSGIPVLMQMGLLAAFTVFFTVLVALTLTPALLSLAGARAKPRKRTRNQSKPAKTGFAEKYVHWVTKRAALVVTAVVLLIGIVAIPAGQLRLGLPDGGSEDVDSTAYQAFSQVEAAFGAGANGPIVVTADVKKPIAKKDIIGQQAKVGGAIWNLTGVKAVVPIGVSEDRTTMAFQVVSAEGPSEPGTVDLVDGLRGHVTSDMAKDGIEIGVTGQTAANIEVSQQLADALPLYLLLVIGLSLGLLTMVFRSVVVPIVATAGFLLSVAGAFGAIVAVYQWGWLGDIFKVHQPGAVMSFMPTLLIGILFGLAMDYQMFLVSGMKEAHSHGRPAKYAVRSGFVSAAQVVTAAAGIMISVFFGFVYADMTMVRPIGFGLAVGVLIDAFLIRLTLTPALMSLLGDRAWWIPKWLDRILPNLDVEGTALERGEAHDEHAKAMTDADEQELAGWSAR